MEQLRVVKPVPIQNIKASSAGARTLGRSGSIKTLNGQGKKAGQGEVRNDLELLAKYKKLEVENKKLEEELVKVKSSQDATLKHLVEEVHQLKEVVNGLRS